MIYYVSGPVTVLEPGLAVIDCGGAAHVFEATAGGVEDVLDVLERAVGLFGGGHTVEFAGGRVDAELA